MNGRIVIDIRVVGEPPDDTYHFSIQHPDGVTLDQVASVLNVVVRNLRRRAYADLAGGLEQLRATTPLMPDELGPDDEAHL